MDIFSEIKKILVKQLALDEGEVVPEAHLQDDLGADSLGLLNLAEALSELYEINVIGDDIVELENLDELVKLVESRIASK
ncbi:MAG: phosphopantetheine-binding protein [Thermodesulfobacteriota bacterium]|nr:phosphopantetheine-binding protein [Thermodesulfobacteriota bacterium]